MRGWVRAGGGKVELMAGRGYAVWGMQFFCASYAFRDGQNLHVHTLSLNLHTVPNPKRVLKTELGTQNFLPAEMTLGLVSWWGSTISDCRTVGFTIFLCILALVHKNSSYVEYTIYSRNILLIYVIVR